jgi:hypothetical protein
MRRRSTTFSEIAIGSAFDTDGSKKGRWVKKSSRTATIYGQFFIATPFYFKQTDKVWPVGEPA